MTWPNASALAGRFPKNQSQLAWACSFGQGMTFGTWTPAGSSFVATVTGKDEATGFNMNSDVVGIFGTGAAPSLYESTLSGTSDEVTVIMRDSNMQGLKQGAREMRIEASNIFGGSIGVSKPQGGMQLKVFNPSQSILKDQYFCRKYFTPQDDYMTAMSQGGAPFFNIYDDKTGEDGIPTLGDIRFSINLVMFTPGTTTARSRIDNNANGTADVAGPIPSVGNINVSTGGFSGNHDVVVPIIGGRQYMVEVFRKFPPKIWRRRSTFSDIPGATGAAYEQELTLGRTIAVLTDMVTGTRYLLCDIVGGQQNGNENLYPGRLLHICYTSGGRTIPNPGPQNAISISGIEYRDNMDYNMLAGF